TQAMQQVGLLDRMNDRTDDFSGGMRRRVEIAKCLLTRPRVLLLDEPSTGLDPEARLQLADILRAVADQGTTVLLTTHLMDEAQRCDRLVLMNGGKVAAVGSPAELTAALGGETVIIRTTAPEAVIDTLQKQHAGKIERDGDELRFSHDAPHALISTLYETHGAAIHSLAISKPSLEHAYLDQTGKRLG